MVGQDIINMSIGELKRLKIIQECIERHMTQKNAASVIGVSERQIRRLVSIVRDEGIKGIIHKSRGRISNRKFPDPFRKKVIKIYKKKYEGFGPLLATEKLLELDEIRVSDETLRTWLMQEGIWTKRRKRSGHRQWRERKECFGQMIQVDGSHHDWLEGRGPELVLMGYIDDATNNVFGRFYDYEGTMPAMDSFKGYIQKYGLPQSVYLDKHSTYKSTKKQSIEEELDGKKPMSQFERALTELGVKVIHAHSPQAKGRVERLFGVLQDRLIKEMRLKRIKTKYEANKFLSGYLPHYNKRFRVCPLNTADVHAQLPKFNIDSILCIKTERTVRNDNTISLHGRFYQITETVKTKKVIIQERIDGSMHISTKGVSLKYKEIEKRSPKAHSVADDQRAWSRTKKPPKDHPWRNFQIKKSGPKKKAYAI